MVKYLSSKQMTERGHGSRTKLWRRSRDPDDPFPCPYETGPNSIGWDNDEVEAYEATLQRRGVAKKPISEPHLPGHQGPIPATP